MCHRYSATLWLQQLLEKHSSQTSSPKALSVAASCPYRQSSRNEPQTPPALVRALNAVSSSAPMGGQRCTSSGALSCRRDAIRASTRSSLQAIWQTTMPPLIKRRPRISTNCFTGNISKYFPATVDNIASNKAGTATTSSGGLSLQLHTRRRLCADKICWHCDGS